MRWQRSERQPAVVARPRAANLDEAHLAIELWEYYSHKTLDAEQRLAVELMLAESKDGRWAADTTGRAESRQNGKGDEVEVAELWGLTQRGEAILHTAHEAATAASAHERMVALIEGHRDLRRLVKKKQSWNGNYSLRLDNDSIIVWRTRTGAGGRGLDDISRIVVDEAQHAQPEELASSLPILSVNPNPQKNFVGSGGIAGKSAFWWRQRRRALETKVPGRFAWLEHSAESVTLDEKGRIVSKVGDIRDPETWARANPAYPSRISHDFLLDQLETLGEELFAREHLCVWDPEPVSAEGGDLDVDAWAMLADPGAERGKRVVFGVDVGSDRLAHIAVAWRRPDGLVQVMLADSGVSPLRAPDRLAEVADRWGAPVMLGGPSSSLEDDVRRAEVMSAAEFASGCGRFDDLFREGKLRHGNQPELNEAVRAAQWRKFGTAGERSLVLSGAPLVAPLAAAVRALHGLMTGASAPPAAPMGVARPAGGSSPTADLATLSF